jgi:hypothetical protein
MTEWSVVNLRGNKMKNLKKSIFFSLSLVVLCSSITIAKPSVTSASAVGEFISGMFQPLPEGFRHEREYGNWYRVVPIEE